jgi:hypothetical protein
MGCGSENNQGKLRQENLLANLYLRRAGATDGGSEKVYACNFFFSQDCSSNGHMRSGECAWHLQLLSNQAAKRSLRSDF